MNKDLKVVPIQRNAAYVHHRAMLNRRENNIVDAVELMRRAVEQSPQNLEYKLDLAELYCEIGCHEQSTQLLLDMLAEGDGPSECYYGLALNQLGMNDLSGAKDSLRLYRRNDPTGAHLEEVRQLTAELDFYSELNRNGSRRLGRAARMASRACEAMKSNDSEKACRLFEKSLELASEQYDMRSLYAMALMIRGDSEAARLQAERASEAYPPSIKALCVCAQVYAMLGDAKRAKDLIQRAAGEKPEGQDLRMLVYAMGELDMDEGVAEYARLALQEAPYDRELLHMRAVALWRTGVSQARVARFWTRILRLDPQDTVAQFYQTEALEGDLSRLTFGYGYQVPAEEYVRRLNALVGELAAGFEHVEEKWQREPRFRQLMRWAAADEEGRLNRAALTVLTTIDSDEARSLLRSVLFNRDVSWELKAYTAMAMRVQGLKPDHLLPDGSGLAERLMPGTDALLEQLPVGERQLVRYADEVLRREYETSAQSQLTLMWMAYRRLRGTHTDPLLRIEAASAALAYNYLLINDFKPKPAELARAFNCPVRQLVYYARRIAGSVERLENTSDEDL